jgi:UDP-N-acetylmuramyl pentapeptide phosphotransferase/UDP-N-acetylglucosamine-1-phosphate transferase
MIWSTSTPFELAAVVGLAFLASLAVGLLVKRLLLRWQMIDLPNERSSHVQPTVRGGGVGIIAIILTGAGWIGWRERTWTVLILGIIVLFLAVVSFWDDRKPLSWHVRLGTHFSAAALMLVVLVPPVRSTMPIGTVLGSLLVLLWFAGYANVFNFMDGINGLAAGQAVATAMGTALVGLAAGLPVRHPAIVLTAALAGAAGGFLPYNYPRARMFMGDVSSVPLGFILAVVAVWVSRDAGWWLIIPLGLLHANFWLDSGITIIRRILRREVLHRAHREHFYQRLIRAGWSHPAVTGCEMGLQLLVLGVVLTSVTKASWSVGWLVPAVSAIWLAFFGFCEREFRRSQVETGLNLR